MNSNYSTYISSLTNITRRKSRIVNIGNLPLGGDYPIRLQSMTNTLTSNTEETVEQCIRLIHAGSEYVRITAPGIKDAENLENIKNLLLKKGYATPLIADIHFNPKAAEIAAKYVEKVRINPGNFVDKKSFKTLEYTQDEYHAEIDRIRERLLPLLSICKENKTALRIGTNHGSLSDRIMSRYGDTPMGMVESALEFLRICREDNFHQIVLSMKASNTRVMIQAYRLLVQKMNEENMDYPLHLGVTEAGEGEDGRIKSAVGIGCLLADGLGDTIRVSLTEEPEEEIPVARKLVHCFQVKDKKDKFSELNVNYYNPFEFGKRIIQNQNFNFDKKPVVLYSGDETKTNSVIKPDFIKKHNFFEDALHNTFKIIDYKPGMEKINHAKPTFLMINAGLVNTQLIEFIKAHDNCIIIFKPGDNFVTGSRLFFEKLHVHKITHPVILHKQYDEKDVEKFQLQASGEFGSMFSDGFGDGLWLENENINRDEILKTAFGILQACRLRISKTEYISCPSCGRTLFGLQETTAKIRAKTSHLKGLKIGIMGCIVNGPGEMADADYGYVGAGPGKISLYKGQDVVKKNIPTDHAVDELISLIKENGDWKEKANTPKGN